MGCDIHMIVEKNIGIEGEDKWVAWRMPETHKKSYPKKGESDLSTSIALARNYNRFAALAGVRGDGPEQRGVPNDASESTKAAIEYWGADGHSHSWLPLHQATEIFKATECGYRINDPFPSEYPTEYFFGVYDQDNEDRYRLVFWFDN